MKLITTSSIERYDISTVGPRTPPGASETRRRFYDCFRSPRGQGAIAVGRHSSSGRKDKSQPQCGRWATLQNLCDLSAAQERRIITFALHLGGHLRTRVSPHYLRWLSEGAQEGVPHTVTVDKTRLPSDDIDGMAALLHHQPGGLYSQVLDRLSR